TVLMAAGADMGALPFVTVYDAVTGQLRLHFLAYEGSFRGGVRVAVADINGDGVPDIITAPGGVRLHVNSDLSAFTDPSMGRAPEVKVFSGVNGSLLADFLAYNPSFKAGLFVAVGNIDGHPDIITGPDLSAPNSQGVHISPAPLGDPDVRVFFNSHLIKTGGVLAPDREFLAYAAGVQAGVRVAVGDLNGDGVPDIVTVPGPLSGADVRIFDGKQLLNNSVAVKIGEFLAFDPRFFGGLNVALGDVNADGTADIVTGVDGYGGPEVRVFNGKAAGMGSPTPAPIDDFMAFDPTTFGGGVRVGAADVNGDGHAEIFAASGPGGIRIGGFPLDPDVERGGLSQIRVFNVSTGQPFALSGAEGGFSPFTFPGASHYSGGVFVAATGTGFVPALSNPTVLMAAGADMGTQPWVNVYDAVTGQLKLHFLAYEAGFLGGVRVAVADINGDGVPDIITAPGGVRLHVNSDLSAFTDPSMGRAPEVKVFSGFNGSLLADFLAYNPSFKAGLFVAVGNIDGHPDIITGPDLSAPNSQGVHISPAPLGDPDVRVFFNSHLIKTGGVLAPDREFLAYAAGVQSGVRVAVG